MLQSEVKSVGKSDKAVLGCICAALYGCSFANTIQAKADLNGDGKIDAISCESKVVNGRDKCQLTVNGKSVRFELENGVKHLKVVDVDSSDRFKEVYLQGAGDGDYPVDRIFRFDGKKLIDMGELGGTAFFDGSGRVVVTGWLAGFVDSYGVMRYDKSKHRFVSEAIPDLYPMDTQTKATKPFSVYTNSECKKTLIQVRAGDKVKLVAAKVIRISSRKNPVDDVRVLIRTKHGMLGWVEKKVIQTRVKQFPCAG